MHNWWQNCCRVRLQHMVVFSKGGGFSPSKSPLDPPLLIHGESCKDVILELSRLATGPLEHLVEINSLMLIYISECDLRPWFHGPLALCNDGFKLSVFLVGFQLLAFIDTLSDIALCVCSRWLVALSLCLWACSPLDFADCAEQSSYVSLTRLKLLG